MSNPYADIRGTEEEPKRNFETVGGAFGCQMCMISVSGARYYQDKGVLVWTCVDGHDSEMKWKP